MAVPPSEEEREQVASELRRVREGVRERALVEQSAQQVDVGPQAADRIAVVAGMHEQAGRVGGQAREHGFRP